MKLTSWKKFNRQGWAAGCFSDWNSDCKKIGSADGFRILQEFRSKFQSLCFAQLMSSLRNTKTNSNSNLLTFLFLYYLVPTHSFWFDLVENIDHGLILLALNFDLSLSRIEKLLLNILLQKSMKKTWLQNWRIGC